MSNTNLRIGMFIDGNYLLHTSNYYNYIHPQKRRLSIGGLSKFVKREVAKESGLRLEQCMITESHYFRGRLNATDANQRGNQLYNDRVFDDILMSEGVHAHYLPLRNVYGRREERGIDVWLSLEAFEIVMVKKLDYVALIISDTDYVPLVRKLTSLGVKTILLSWEFDYLNDDGVKVVTKTSQELLNTVTYPLDMFATMEHYIATDESLAQSMFINMPLIKTTVIEEIVIGEIEPPVSGEESQSLQDEDSLEIEVSEILSLKQGYGFIKYPNNNLFFHYHDVEGEFSELNQNDTIEFIVGRNNLGHDVAKRVKKVVLDPDDTNSSKNQPVFFDWSKS